MQIYLASPLFNDSEKTVIKYVTQILRGRGYEVFCPLEEENRELELFSKEWYEETYKMDRDAIDASDVLLLLYYGMYSDSGSAWEAGYATAKGKPLIVCHINQDDSYLSNMMIHMSARANISLEDIEGSEEKKPYDFNELPFREYEGRGH